MPETGRSRLRLGYIVVAALVGIKVAEYLLVTVVRSGAWPYLVILAVAGAWLIIYFFMHVHQLWRSRGRG